MGPSAAATAVRVAPLRRVRTYPSSSGETEAATALAVAASGNRNVSVAWARMG